MGVKRGRAKGNKQTAEYGNLEGKHERSGWTERRKRRSESGNAHRENHCEVEPGRTERKNRRLSSQNRNFKGTKETKREGKRPKAKAEGKHSWNSCGSEAGKDERKQTGS